jgi:hypothetical protein
MESQPRAPRLQSVDTGVDINSPPYPCIVSSIKSFDEWHGNALFPKLNQRALVRKSTDQLYLATAMTPKNEPIYLGESEDRKQSLEESLFWFYPQTKERGTRN